MSIEIDFDLPFSLEIDGTFGLQILAETFSVRLSTIRNPVPKFPGAEMVDQVAIMNDETNILSHTHVHVEYVPINQAPLDPAVYSREVSDIAVSISNSLISANRIAYGQYHIDYIYSAARLGPILFIVPPLYGGKRFSGTYDGLQGGITFQLPPKTGNQAAPFASALAQGANLSPADELLYNAKRYLLRGDRRMALANLAISFEVGLADRLASIAVAKGDAALEADIAKAALNDLGTGLAARAIGASFARRSVWGDRFHDVFEWLRVARNGVLHKAQMALSYNGRTRNFANNAELNSLFSDRDWFMAELDASIARVLAGYSPRP